ncbi:hypothetical protein E2C01_024840 [Portunus trituberculatus]|uniref:Uncharacterized protein n=1 Tax=Portunus trituberculatus TaxID=210409 RepID=A0A5B7EEF9_PORTR|nr:hypothetical protein [Portunus trituberculatus]
MVSLLTKDGHVHAHIETQYISGEVSESGVSPSPTAAAPCFPRGVKAMAPSSPAGAVGITRDVETYLLGAGEAVTAAVR